MGSVLFKMFFCCFFLHPNSIFWFGSSKNKRYTSVCLAPAHDSIPIVFNKNNILKKNNKHVSTDSWTYSLQDLLNFHIHGVTWPHELSIQLGQCQSAISDSEYDSSFEHFVWHSVNCLCVWEVRLNKKSKRMNLYSALLKALYL